MNSPERHPNRNVRFWPSRCGSSAKGLGISLLAVGFVAQTFLVYADTTNPVVLSGQQLSGRAIWLENNCQACHQLYGFGGFLGPDLTNVASRFEQQQLADRLALGEGQMPRFEMQPSEIDELWAFLGAMNDSGIGQARNPNLAKSNGASPEVQALAQIITESKNSSAAQGFEIFQTGNCQGCHVLFAESSIGAPDLTKSFIQLTTDQILNVLEHGRPPKMPPTNLSPEQRLSMQAFITFMGEHRQEILSRVVEEPAKSFWSSIPWWEFE